MDKVIELAEELKTELDNLPLFIEFKRVRDLVNNSYELNDLKSQIVDAKNSHDGLKHKELLDRYNNHPLILNYETLKSDVYNYLKEISEIINKK